MSAEHSTAYTAPDGMKVPENTGFYPMPPNKVLLQCCNAACSTALCVAASLVGASVTTTEAGHQADSRRVGRERGRERWVETPKAFFAFADVPLRIFDQKMMLLFNKFYVAKFNRKEKEMKKMKGDPNHMGDKHPFQGNGKTPMPKMGKSAAAHKTAAGVVKAGGSANAAMKGKK